MFARSKFKSKEKEEVTICMIGDTGVGKSSFGNIYLQTNAFEANDGPMPVTLKAVAKSNEVDGMKRWVIDTEGLDDGNSINSVQIQNLAKLMRNYERGINAVVIVLNGRHPRFSQGVKDIIKFTYNAFATKEVLNHICIVFTNCDNPKFPNRNLKKKEYLKCVQNYLSEISSVPIKEIPEIPIYFVDSYAEEDNSETPENMIQFHGWVCSRTPLETKQFKEAGFHEDHFEEVQKRVSKGYTTRGDTTYELFEDQKRTKIVPTNKDPPRFTNWICLKKYEEPIRKVIYDKKPNVDLGFKYSNDGSIRYKVSVDQERKIVRDLRTNIDIEKTPWYNTSPEKRVEAGRRTEQTETRVRKFKRKEVCHHSSHSWFGSSSEDHTHYDIYRIERTEQRTITTDYDGKITTSNWLIVPGSEKKIHIDGGMESGWTSPYEKEI